MARPAGWRKEPARHALAARGIASGRHRPTERTMPEYIQKRTSDRNPLTEKGMKWLFEGTWPVMDQMDVVWDDIEAPLSSDNKDMIPQSPNDPHYSKLEPRIADTVSAIREAARQCTDGDAYGYLAEENLKDMQRLSIVLADHGRYISVRYPKLRSQEFGGSLGEHIENNAAYVKSVSENMLQDLHGYKTGGH